MNQQKTIYLSLAWLLSIAATLTSLYLSEIRLWPVCHLCWYQRIFSYPLVVMLAIALYRCTDDVIPYAKGLVRPGFCFALYQTLEQHIPALQSIGLCGQGPSCHQIHMQWLGFITLPLLSVAYFIVLEICLGMAQRQDAIAS